MSTPICEQITISQYRGDETPRLPVRPPYVEGHNIRMVAVTEADLDWLMAVMKHYRGDRKMGGDSVIRGYNFRAGIHDGAPMVYRGRHCVDCLSAEAVIAAAYPTPAP